MLAFLLVFGFLISGAFSRMEIMERYNDASNIWGDWLLAENQRYHNGEFTAEEAKEKNQICGNFGYGLGDDATRKNLGYITADLGSFSKYSAQDDVFSHWWKYNSKYIYAYMHCMESPDAYIYIKKAECWV